MAEQRDKNFVRGLIALGIGSVLAILGALWAHFSGLPELDDVGRELYPHIPRGYDAWLSPLIGQLVSLTGVFIAMVGLTLAFLYEKPMTWARSALGAFLFTGLTILLFGVIPNEWLTYTQAVWEWTDQKLWIGTNEAATIPIPAALLGGNDLNLSAAAIKDIVAGTYVLVVTGGLGAAMIAWQRRDEIMANREKKRAEKGNVSVYGRPLQKADS